MWGVDGGEERAKEERGRNVFSCDEASRFLANKISQRLRDSGRKRKWEGVRETGREEAEGGRKG